MRPLSEFKVICRDLIGIGVIGLIAVCVGLFANQFREAPLALLYSPKAVRIQEAVANLKRKTLFPSESTTLGSSGHVRYLEFASFQEIVEKKTKGIILDARPGIFHQLGHVPGAISISREEFEADYAVHRSTLEKDKSLLIAIYCSDSSCEDSQLVADALVNLGYMQVFVFKGGWSEWMGAGLPEEKAEDVK